MEHPNTRVIPAQLLGQFLLGGDHPAADLLGLDELADALGHTADRIYTPVITLALWLRQAAGPDHSCRAAVEGLAAVRTGAGLAACAADTGGYCKARARLPLEPLVEMTGLTGRRVRARGDGPEFFHGRPVKIADGTGCSMPDTPENRREFFLPSGQKPGVGFPMARVLVVVCLACGVVLDAAVNPSRGKASGECAALRGLHNRLEPGDILLGDSLYGSYLDIALLAAAGVDCVLGVHARRKVDFRHGRRLGPEDHVVAWAKPHRPGWMSQAAYDALPAAMEVRELRVRLVRAGFKTRTLVLATTLLDPAAFPKAELAGLSRARWQVELDIRALKHALALDVLRCKTPAAVHKEIWVHLLAYNLVRGAMAAAAAAAGVAPRRLSFTGARQTLSAFAPRLAAAAAAAGFAAVVAMVLVRLSSHRVGDRPDRFEPRERKRRPKKSKYMQYPRPEARRRAALTG